ncbi:UDP-2,3-diacylglucosamine diphosphatase [Aliivibrio kagoshimensis]|uniref:UDP-2,3-diacylglucosamine diphosphatase n=1 Tax=Aliivibrio kagoshimensis TaxID=2910230 RepID=UPI003D0F8AAD
MTTLFISDLHLSEELPAITKCFLAFMKNEAINADALYVLGDLFETWFGDDDNSAFNRTIINAFKTLTDSGVPCFFLEGNRDFLIGKKFAKQTGMTLLPEICTIDLYGTKTLIMHGDTLCTKDEGYQKYRATVHKPWVQWIFLHLPLNVRHRLVGNIKSSSAEKKEQKQMVIMDVTPEEVFSEMQRFNVTQLIHGHTHRPAVHELTLNSGLAKRVVLGDWYSQGSVLLVTEQSMELQVRSFI